MNEGIFRIYCDIKSLIQKAESSPIKGCEERELVKDWQAMIASFDGINEEYKERYERFSKRQKSFTPEQIDFICYQIGDWYLEWKDRLVIDLENGTHRLGYAKEQLKTIICGN